MNHGSSQINSNPDSNFNSRSRLRNQHRRAQHRRHEEAIQSLSHHHHAASAPSSLHQQPDSDSSNSNRHNKFHHSQSKTQSKSKSRNQSHTHSHSKPKSTSNRQGFASSKTTLCKSSSFATSASASRSSTLSSLHSHQTSSLPTAKSRTVEYSANKSAAGWELRPHIPLVLALTSCGIIILLMIAGLTFVMLWRRRAAKQDMKRISRERRVREDGRREGLEMRLEGLGIELEGIDHQDTSLSFEGRDKDGNLIEGTAVREIDWKDSNSKNSFEKQPTPMLNENWNQESMGSNTISSPKAAFISSIYQQSKNNGGTWRTLIPRKGKGENDFHGTIEQYVYTPEITIGDGSGKNMWGNLESDKGGIENQFGLGIGIPTTPGGSPIADGWGGFLKKPKSPHPSSSSMSPFNNQPVGSVFSPITFNQHERFGKSFDEVDVALDLAPAYSAAYAAAAPKRFLESPSQVNKDSTSRIGRFSFGFGATLAAGAGLTRKLSRKLDVRKSMKIFSNQRIGNNQSQQIIPGPTTFYLKNTPAIGELEFVTAPLASPGMSNPFESAFANTSSCSANPIPQSHLRPTLDRFDSGASTLVPGSRASQPESSFGRKQSSRVSAAEEDEEEEQPNQNSTNANGTQNPDEDDDLNPRLSSSTIEKGLLWRTLPGGALRDGEPLGVAREDQLMAISASSSEASLVAPRRASNRNQLPLTRNGEEVDSPVDPRATLSFEMIKGSRSEESSSEQIIFSGNAASRLSNMNSSSYSIGLGISMEESEEQPVEDVVERVYRSVQQLVREGLGTPRKRARAASDARSLKFPGDSSIDSDFSISAVTVRSRSATMESARSPLKGRNRSGTNDSNRSSLGRRRANSEGRRRTLVTEEIDKFYPGAALSRQGRSRKSSGASLAVPTRFSVKTRLNMAVKSGEEPNKHLSSASTSSVWSRDSRPASYIPQFNGEETRDSIPPPVPEKDGISPQLNEASTALRAFFDSPTEGKRRRIDSNVNESDNITSVSNNRSPLLSSSSKPQSRFSPFDTPSPEARKMFSSSNFGSIESSLPTFPSSATISPTINYPQPKPNSKGPVHPVELQMRLEDAREEILGNGKGRETFYSSVNSYTPILSSSKKSPLAPSSEEARKVDGLIGLCTSKEGRTLIKPSITSHHASISTPEECDTSHCGNASADSWSSIAGDDFMVSMEVENNKVSGSNTVRISSAFDPRRSGSFVTKTTTRHRSSHASQTPIVTVTEAFEPTKTSIPSRVEEISISSNSPETTQSTPMRLLSSSSPSPKSPSNLQRSRTTSGDSRRGRENSSGDDVSKSPRTRPRGATFPAPRAALRGARAAAAAAASAILGDSESSKEIKVESPRIGSPRVAFAPLDNDSRPSSRPSSPRVAFIDNSASSSVSDSPKDKKSDSDFEPPICSSPLRKNANATSSSSKDLIKNRIPNTMSTSKKRTPSNLRIDTSGKHISSYKENFDISEEMNTPILGGGEGSDNSLSSDSIDESFSPASSSSSTNPLSIRSSLPFSISLEHQPRSRDLIPISQSQKRITNGMEEELINLKTNSLLSATNFSSDSSLKRSKAIVTTSRTSDYASPTMLVFRFYEHEMEER